MSDSTPQTVTYTKIPPEDTIRSYMPPMCPHCGRNRVQLFIKFPSLSFRWPLLWECRICKKRWLARRNDHKIHAVWIFLRHDFSYRHTYVGKESVKEEGSRKERIYVWAVHTDHHEAEMNLNEHCTYDEDKDVWNFRGETESFLEVQEDTARGKLSIGKPKFEGDNLGWLAKYRK